MLKSKVSPEDRLLRYCAKIYLNTRTKNRLPELLCGNLNWSYILEESKTEGISCLVYNNLLPFQDNVPQNIWNNFKEIYYANAYRNTIIYQQMNIILSSFNRENLKVIPLKGVFLAQNIYNNIALRSMNDIDLLVKREELPKIDKLLESLDYRAHIPKNLLYPAMEKSYLNSIDYFKIYNKKETAGHEPLHIHWHIVNVSLPTYLYTKNIKMDRFWQCATPTDLAGTDTLQLPPHLLIIYLSEHALKHSFGSLILLSDIDAAIKKYLREIHWDDLIKEAINLGMQRQVFYGLYFSNYFLETEMPDCVLSKLKPQNTGFLEKRFLNSVSNNNRKTKLCYFVYLSTVGGTINKIRFLFRTLFPPSCVLALFLNAKKNKITKRDYFLFLFRRLLHLKSCLPWLGKNT